MKITIITIFTALVLAGIVLIPNAFAENIPNWVKNNAGWWATDVISEAEFLNAIEFLVNEEIIQVSEIVPAKDNTGYVPNWIKNNAGWWATDVISEAEFLNAIEFLIKEGIITLNKECKFEGVEFSHLSTDPLHQDLLGGFSVSVKETFSSLHSAWISAEYLLCKNIDLTFIDEFASVDKSMFTKNSHGFRGAEFSTVKPSDTYRIFLIGGSAVYGEHVNENETKAVYLQELFEDQNLDFHVEVINAGMPSAWSKTEIVMIKEKIIRYDPDLLIVFDGWNDVTGELVKNANWSEEANVENWVSRWTEVCEIGKQNNFETIITIQPILGSGDRLFTNQEAAEYRSHYYILSHISLLENYVGNLKNLESTCTRTADLTNMYDDVFLPVYTDLGHVNAIGGKIAAYEFFKLAVPVIFQDDIKTQNKLLSENSYDQFKIKHAKKIATGNDATGKLIEDAKITSDLKGSRFWFTNLRNVDFSNLNLVDVDFRFAKLENISFKGATLQNVLMPRTMLDKVDFSNAILSNVKFSGSVLTNSNFEGAVLDNAEFLGATVKNTNFKNSQIKNTVFERANIVVSDFSTSKLQNVTIKSTSFYNVDFTGIDFSTIKIGKGVAFADSLFIDSNIAENELPGTDFALKDVSGSCIIEKSITRNLFFSDTANSSCTIPGSNLAGLDLSETDLSDVVFSKITTFPDIKGLSAQSFIDYQHLYRDYYGTILAYTNLSNSNLSGNNLSVTIFSNANLSYTDLSLSDIRYSDLTNANLTGADLTNANLTGADLTNANLTGADLTNANLKCLNHPICLN